MVKKIVGLGFLGLLVFLALYVISVLWWSMWLYFGVHWGHAETWSYGWVCTHWGLLMPLVLG